MQEAARTGFAPITGAALRVAAGLALALTAALAGCQPDKGNHDKLVIRGQRPPTAPAGANLYKLQLYYLIERVPAGAAPQDLWRFMDETPLSPAQRRLLERNGLRLGIGGEIALQRLNDLVASAGNVEVQPASPIYARQAYALDLPHGLAGQDAAILYERADGSLCGRDLLKATTYVRFQCLAAQEADTTEVRVSQWILHGDPRPKYRQTPTGLILGEERPRFWLSDCETAVRLREGQILALGPASGRALSIGELLFVRQQRPDTYLTTIILYPQLVSPGAVPAGTPVASPLPENGAGLPTGVNSPPPGRPGTNK